jgi:hypothetical protein
MATTDPKTAAVKPAPPAPAPVVEDEADEAPEPAPAPKPVVETVSFAGIVLEKTVHPDGECETEVLREPSIDPLLVQATRAQQRSRGH